MATSDSGYVAEVGVSMVCTPFALFRQSKRTFAEAEQAAEHLNASPHLYIIAARPRVTLDPGSVVVTKQCISGRLVFHTATGVKHYDWTTRNALDDDSLSLESPSPHSTFALRAKDGRIIGGDCALILPLANSAGFAAVPAEHDLKVLYVGQAFGDDGDRIALDRLQSHSTLQAIYADAMQEAPHLDIWLLLLEAEATQLLTLFPSSLASEELSEGTLIGKAQQLLKDTIPLQQRINFAEAALIKYFSPAYNTIYKSSFPHPSHSSYAECYKADINAVSAELQTLGVATRTFSDVVQPAYAHIASYPLHSKEDRRHLFEFVEGFPIPHGPITEMG